MHVYDSRTYVYTIITKFKNIIIYTNITTTKMILWKKMLKSIVLYGFKINV